MCVCVRACVCVYMCVYVCVYMYVCMHVCKGRGALAIGGRGELKIQCSSGGRISLIYRLTEHILLTVR